MGRATLVASIVLSAVVPPPARGDSRPATILSYPESTTAPAGPPAAEPSRPGTSLRPPPDAAEVARRFADGTASLPWTRLALDMFVKHKVAPTRAARALALVHVAMHDALRLAPDSGHAAVAGSAARLLAYVFPAEQRWFDEIAAIAIEARVRAGQDRPGAAARGLAVGRRVGERVVEWAQADGAARGWNGLRLEWYGEGRWFGPGAWEPTPPYFYYPPTEPFAPGWKPWLLDAPSRFRPTPPEYGSPVFLKDLQEVVDVQRHLTPEERRIAQFWADGHGSVTPPGHWNQIALDLAARDHLDSGRATILFAYLNMALADAFIAAWDAKYCYWTARPITAARDLLGIELRPAILTPPFPSYVSGHATFSGAAGRVLGFFFPGDALRLEGLAEEAARSRLYAGIHYRHDNQDGLLLGRKVAERALARLREAEGVHPRPDGRVERGH